MDASTQRPIDRYLANFAADHRNPLNQWIHAVAVPAILWSVVALVWCVPVFGTWTRTGIWAALVMFFAWSFYNRLSRRLGLGLLAAFFVIGCTCRLVEMHLGLPMLLAAGAAVLVLAWIARLLGQRLEGHRPGLPADLVHLLIGPAWVMARCYRRLGWSY